MQTVSFSLPDAMVAQLDKLCAESARPRETVLADLVAELLEDLADVQRAEAILARNEPTYTSKELRDEFGL